MGNEGVIFSRRFFSNLYSQFGKTHFIVGYEQAKRQLAFLVNNQLDSTTPTAATKQPVRKRGRKSKYDSSHLIDESCIVQPFFTQSHDVRSIIACLIGQAEKCIIVAAFTLTDKKITDLLVQAHKAGIKVEIVTDYGNINEAHSKINLLIECGIPVFYYKAALNPNPRQKNSRYARMHHKFVVIDDKVGFTGSTNLTKSGQRDNIENIVLIRDKQALQGFKKEFESLKQCCKPCK
jgi:cardiolipin hydrolase